MFTLPNTARLIDELERRDRRDALSPFVKVARKNPEIIQDVLTAVDQGLVLRVDVIEILLFKTVAYEVVQQHWGDASRWFEDDASFSNTRFAMLIDRWQPAVEKDAAGNARPLRAQEHVPVAKFELAVAQMNRLLHQGVFVPAYAHTLWAYGMESIRQVQVVPPFMVELAAHGGGNMRTIDRNCDAVYGAGFRGERLAFWRDFRDQIQVRRRELFMRVWAAHILNPATGSAAHGLAVGGMLIEVYPQEWRNGYAWYQRDVLGVDATCGHEHWGWQPRGDCVCKVTGSTVMTAA